MSPLTFIFTAIIAVCVVVTVLINSLTAKHSSLRDSQKELESLLRLEARKSENPESDEDLSDLDKAAKLEEAKQTYDAALEAYNESIKKFPGVVTAGVLGFKPIKSIKTGELSDVVDA